MAARQIVQAVAVAAEQVGQFAARQAPQIAAGVKVERVQFVERYAADAGDFAQGQHGEKGIDFVRRQHKLAVWLAPVGSDFGEEFVGGDAGGGGQAGGIENVGANLPRGSAGGGQAEFVGTDVEIGFIQRQRFDHIAVAGKHFMNLLRHAAVQIKARRHKHRLRAAAAGGGRGHRRMQPPAARFVGRGAHHRARAFPRHHQRPAAQLGALAQFDRSVKGVHVDVDDFADGGVGHKRQKQPESRKNRFQAA